MGRCGSEAKREIPGEHLQLRLSVQTTQMQNVPQSHLARNLTHKVCHLHGTQCKEAGKQITEVSNLFFYTQSASIQFKVYWETSKKKSVIWFFTPSQPVYKVYWETSKKKVSNLFCFYTQSVSIQAILGNKVVVFKSVICFCFTLSQRETSKKVIWFLTPGHVHHVLQGKEYCGHICHVS